MRVLISTLLGLEAFVASELQERGIDKADILVQDGRVYIQNLVDQEALSRAVAIANIYSRCAERVYVELIYQEVRDFDTLFDLVRSYPWQKIIRRNSAFVVERGYSRKSDLFGVPAIQGMIKKAIVEHLLLEQNLSLNDTLIENEAYGQTYLHFSFMNNQFSLCVDTSGDGLHKRGYRTQAGLAPIKETLAAALVYMAKYKPFSSECLYDPFCGSGTIAIEAAQMAINRAPGLLRSFAGEELMFLDSDVFLQVREEAGYLVEDEVDTPLIFASDIDPEVLKVARDNARRAGVESLIEFSQRDVLNFDLVTSLEEMKHESMLIVCNPPYGERLMDERSLDILFQGLKKVLFSEKGIAPNLRLTIISAEQALESIWGFVADKRRKLYNGMLPCTVFQYFKETGTPLTKKDFTYLHAKRLSGGNKKEKSSFFENRSASASISTSREYKQNNKGFIKDRDKLRNSKDSEKIRGERAKRGRDLFTQDEIVKGKFKPSFNENFRRNKQDKVKTNFKKSIQPRRDEVARPRNEAYRQGDESVSFRSAKDIKSSYGAKRAREKKPRGF